MRNKNVDGKIVLNVKLDVYVRMSRVDDMEPLIQEPLNWYNILFFLICFSLGKDWMEYMFEIF